MCIKNACKSLGSYFGRNLNRDIVDQYQPVVSHIEAKLVSKLDGLMKAKKEEGKAQKKSTPKSKDNG